MVDLTKIDKGIIFAKYGVSPSSNVAWKTPPKTSDDYGEDGWMSYDNEFHYIYVKGKWLRQPIADFEF